MKRFGALFFCFSLFILPLYAGGNQEGSRTSARPYIGDGGRNISITIKVPTAEGLPPSLSDIHIQAYRRLLDNFIRYSSIFVRPDLEFDYSVFREALLEFYADDDPVRSDLGHLRMTEYLMTGSISQSPFGYLFHLQVARTEEHDKSIAYSFMADCTFTELANLSIVNRASLDLLEQMGVQLTERARTELAGAGAANRAQGRTVMREAIDAQQAGDEARARFLFNQAAELDAQLAEEAARRLTEMGRPLAMLSTEIVPSPTPLPPPPLEGFVPLPERLAPPPTRRTGNLGHDARARQQAFEIEQENERIQREIEAENERIRAENARRQAEIAAENARRQAEVDAENARRQAAVDAENAERDAHNREIWRRALADSEEHYRRFLATALPIELVYENRLNEMPETHNFHNRTVSLNFNAALVPVESGWIRAVENDVNNLRSQLLATGRAEAWGFANWPQTPITSPSPFMNRRGSVVADAELLDDDGRTLGTRTFNFNWELTVDFSARGLSFNINENDLFSQFVLFENINIFDITDTLQIRIARINGEDAERAAAEGGIQYSTDFQRWRLVERRQRQQAAQRARQAAGDRFLRNSGLSFMGLGGGGANISAGGGEIELRMFHWFALQTGISFVAFQEENETMIQLPVLARINLMPRYEQLRSFAVAADGASTAMWYFSPYVGMGINFMSPSPITPIVGFEVGLTGVSFRLFGGGRLQKNVFSDSYVFTGYGGIGFYRPFRNH